MEKRETYFDSVKKARLNKDYGVKGMKWGERKAEADTPSSETKGSPALDDDTKLKEVLKTAPDDFLMFYIHQALENGSNAKTPEAKAAQLKLAQTCMEELSSRKKS